MPSCNSACRSDAAALRALSCHPPSHFIIRIVLISKAAVPVQTTGGTATGTTIRSSTVPKSSGLHKTPAVPSPAQQQRSSRRMHGRRACGPHGASRPPLARTPAQPQHRTAADRSQPQPAERAPAAPRAQLPSSPPAGPLSAPQASPQPHPSGHSGIQLRAVGALRCDCLSVRVPLASRSGAQVRRGGPSTGSGAAAWLVARRVAAGIGGRGGDPVDERSPSRTRAPALAEAVTFPAPEVRR